jgi:hypothetical protein
VQKRSIIVIHGVGCPALGDILAPVNGAIRQARNGDDLGYRDDLMLGEIVYPRIRMVDGPIEELIEVNWADVERPEKTLLGLATYLMQLLIACLHLGAGPPRSDDSQNRFAHGYRMAFESLLIWCLYPPILLLFLQSCKDWPEQLAVAVVMVVALAVLAKVLSRYSARFMAGYVWSAILAIDATAYIDRWSSPEVLTRLSTYLYTSGQGITICLVLLAMGEVLMRGHWKGQKDYLLTRLALLYGPFLAISTVGAVIWAFSLQLASRFNNNPNGYEEWGTVFLKTLGYDLAATEYLFASAVALIGMLAIAGVMKYFIDVRISISNLSPGRKAQDFVASLLIWMPTVIATVIVCFSAFAFLGMRSSGDTRNVLEIYSGSALRIVPYLPFLIGPLALLLDVLGDVVFYILPAREQPGRIEDGVGQKKKELSTAKKSKRRLLDALVAVRAKAPDNKIIVLSHSQGSVIALDVVGENSGLNCQLITAGSPVQSLYQRFLRSSPVDRNLDFSPPTDWMNLYRSGDYIAGPIGGLGAHDVNIGNGGHTEYWSDAKVIRELLQGIEELRRQP